MLYIDIKIIRVIFKHNSWCTHVVNPRADSRTGATCFGIIASFGMIFYELMLLYYSYECLKLS
jgi:hypothetical protein